MRRANVYLNKTLAGELTECAPNKYVFAYDKNYLLNPDTPPISVTLPKREQPFESNKLFPFFANMLPEGANKAIQCKLLKIDENDMFGHLLATEKMEGIGSVRVEECND